MAGFCLVDSGGRFACWFREVAGWLRCFVWGSARSTPGGVGGLMLWDLQEVAVKPFANFSNEILMVLNSQEAAVNPFTHFSNEILIF